MKRFFSAQSQSVRYVFVGLYNTVVGYFVFWLISCLLDGKAHYLFILGVSFFISLTHAYILQKFFVFRSSGKWLSEYIRFFSVNISGVAVNAFLLTVFVESGLDLMVSQAIATLAVTALSYFGHRKFSFRSS